MKGNMTQAAVRMFFVPALFPPSNMNILEGQIPQAYLVFGFSYEITYKTAN